MLRYCSVSTDTIILIKAVSLSREKGETSPFSAIFLPTVEIIVDAEGQAKGQKFLSLLQNVDFVGVRKAEERETENSPASVSHRKLGKKLQAFRLTLPSSSPEASQRRKLETIANWPWTEKIASPRSS